MEACLSFHPLNYTNPFFFIFDSINSVKLLPEFTKALNINRCGFVRLTRKTLPLEANGMKDVQRSLTMNFSGNVRPSSLHSPSLEKALAQ